MGDPSLSVTNKHTDTRLNRPVAVDPSPRPEKFEDRTPLPGVQAGSSATVAA